jgi:hypothetical protein
MNIKIALIGAGVAVVIVLVIGFYEFLSFFPHSDTTILTGPVQTSQGVIVEHGGVPQT